MKRYLVAFVLAVRIVAAEEVVDIGEVAVTEEAVKNSPRVVPRNVTIVSSEEIEKSGAKNLMEILGSLPGVSIGDTSGSGSGKFGIISLRGEGEAARNNVLLLIDGITQNSLDMAGPDYSSISIEQIERVEVLPGGSGVLYGEKAIGGVINIITKKIKKPGISGMAKIEYGSYATLGSGIGLNYSGDCFYAGFEYFGKNSKGYRNFSYYFSDDVSGKFGFKWDTRNYFDFKISSHDDFNELPGAINKADYENDRRKSGLYQSKSKTNETNYSFNYKYKGVDREGELENSFNYKIRKSDIYSSIDTEQKSNKLTLKKDLFGSDFTIGMDTLNGRTKNGNNEVYKDQIGFYFYDRAEVLKELIFSIGYRYENSKLTCKIENTENRETKDYREQLVDGGFNYNYSEFGTLFFNYAQSYRTPTTDEFFEVGFQGSGNYFNKNLKPQRGENIEFGIKDGNDNFALNMSVYKNTAKDEIYYGADANGAFHNMNMIGKTLRYGYEVALEENLLSFITIKESYSAIKSEVTEGANKGKEVPGVPEEKFNVTAKLEILENLNVNIGYNFVGRAYAISDNANSGEKLGPYKTVKISVNTKICGMEIYGGINNLCDEKYSEYVVKDWQGALTYYPSPERNYYAGIKYEF